MKGPRHCIGCKFGQVTISPSVGGFHDGVYCRNREMAKKLDSDTDEENYVPEFDLNGFIHLWRIESLEGYDASCDCFTQHDERPSDTRVHTAVEVAEDLFWKVIAQAFPEAESGDFPPDAQLALDNMVEASVKLWLRFNHPLLQGKEEEQNDR